MRAVIFLLLVAAASCFSQRHNFTDKIRAKIHDRIKDFICKGDGPDFAKIAAHIKDQAGNGTANGTGQPDFENIKQNIIEHIKEHFNRTRGKVLERIRDHLNMSGAHANETIRQHIAEHLNRSGGAPLVNLIQRIRQHLNQSGGDLKEFINMVKYHIRRQICQNKDGSDSEESEESVESEESEQSSESDEDDDDDERRPPSVRAMVMRSAHKMMGLMDAVTDLIRCSASTCHLAHRMMARNMQEAKH